MTFNRLKYLIGGLAVSSAITFGADNNNNTDILSKAKKIDDTNARVEKVIKKLPDFYIVKDKDTLSGIAEKLKVNQYEGFEKLNPMQIAKLLGEINDIKNIDCIKPGQKIFFYPEIKEKKDFGDIVIPQRPDSNLKTELEGETDDYSFDKLNNNENIKIPYEGGYFYKTKTRVCYTKIVNGKKRWTYFTISKHPEFLGKNGLKIWYDQNKKIPKWGTPEDTINKKIIKKSEEKVIKKSGKKTQIKDVKLDNIKEKKQDEIKNNNSSNFEYFANFSEVSFIFDKYENETIIKNTKKVKEVKNITENIKKLEPKNIPSYSEFVKIEKNLEINFFKEKILKANPEKLINKQKEVIKEKTKKIVEAKKIVKTEDKIQKKEIKQEVKKEDKDLIIEGIEIIKNITGILIILCGAYLAFLGLKALKDKFFSQEEEQKTAEEIHKNEGIYEDKNIDPKNRIHKI